MLQVIALSILLSLAPFQVGCSKATGAKGEVPVSSTPGEKPVDGLVPVSSTPLNYPEPHPASGGNVTDQPTTVSPNVTSTVTPVPTSNATTTPLPNTTTIAPTSPTPTTKTPPTSPTTPVPVPTNGSSTTPSTTVSPSTTASPSTTVLPPTPLPDRKFDAFSFLGGFSLGLGLVAIGFLSYKFYLSRQENYYHTL